MTGLLDGMELRTCLNTHHTVMQAWSPLAAGGYGLLESKMLRELGAQYGKPSAQAAIRFSIQRGIPTSRSGALRNNAAVENYLHEAGLVSDAPSGTAYTDSQGHTVSNLGVHEHWNNSAQKQYSRNLGGSEGIELISITK